MRNKLIVFEPIYMCGSIHYCNLIYLIRIHVYEGIRSYEDGKHIKHGEKECPCIKKHLELEIRDAKFQTMARKQAVDSPFSKGSKHHLAGCWWLTLMISWSPVQLHYSISIYQCYLQENNSSLFVKWCIVIASEKYGIRLSGIIEHLLSYWMKF